MPIDYYEDLMPRNAPVPAPLIEMKATPLVPEVSLLLDQDRNKSVHLNTNTAVNSVDQKSANSHKEEQEVPYGNQFESYNTWKAKNAQLLSAITGSSGGPETVAKYSKPRNNNGVQRDQSNEKELYLVEEMKYLRPVSLRKQIPSRNEAVNKPERECSSGNGNIGQHPVPNIDQEHINPPGIPVCYTQSVNNYSQPRSKDLIYSQTHHRHYQYPSTFNQTKSCSSTNVHLPINKEMQCPNMHFNTHHELREHMYIPQQVQSVPDNKTNQNSSNQLQCQCGQRHCGVTPNNRGEYVNVQPCISKEDRSNDSQTATGKLVSPVDIAHVNNQAIIDLYHIINLQNEQIFMLQNQVKQVLQLHLDCEKSVKQNFNCQSCSCVQKNSCCNEKPTCMSVQKENEVKCKIDKSISGNPGNYEKPKRSIGVMTSSVEKPEETSTNVYRQTENHFSSKGRQKKKRHINSVNLPSHSTHPNRRDHLNSEEIRRKKISSNTAKSSNPVESNQVDNSFSLNEAGLVIKTTSEQDDLSPNTSVHVDLQDYCSSSVESDSEGSASSSNEDEPNSESDGSSTEPPLSWTFYNRVVGQVNKILKKTPTQPQQEHPPLYISPANHMYGLNADYETENNWSKRVTFDGPPLEDSDNNLPHMREAYKFNQPLPFQDRRMSDGRGTMQDFMMYNYAKGNTNLSFATLRYLDRYNRLPSHRSSKAPDQIYQGYQKEHRSNKKSMKKKTKNFEKYSDMPPHQMNKRKSSTPSSKLLDITALKQQPKLF